MIYDSCENIPYTVSIQFDSYYLKILTDEFRSMGLSNKVGNHISIKYLGYEEFLTEDKLNATLERLCNLNFKKISIEVVGFDVMKSNNTHFNDLLYLKVEPYLELYKLHCEISRLLRGLTDIYLAHDWSRFVPHISCGVASDVQQVHYLNDFFTFSSATKISIENWYLVLHTSLMEYLL